jgi:hypothetical protein
LQKLETGRGKGGYHWPAVWIHSHIEYQGDDCLIWPFQHGKKGYGKISLEGVDGHHHKYTPHAIMCELKHGYKPPRNIKWHIVAETVIKGAAIQSIYFGALSKRIPTKDTCTLKSERVIYPEKH